LLTTGDMARLSQSTLRTVRFYEESGILEPAQRTEGGHRLFASHELDKLRLVTDLRNAGLTLDEIKHLLEIKSRSGSGALASRELGAQIDAQIQLMSQRIRLLERVRAELERTRGSLAACSECHDNDCFPDDCGRCQVIKDGRDVSNAARVLWQLGRES
jgi:DNA-binding transcriptional MerR regulator